MFDLLSVSVKMASQSASQASCWCRDLWCSTGAIPDLVYHIIFALNVCLALRPFELDSTATAATIQQSLVTIFQQSFLSEGEGLKDFCVTADLIFDFFFYVVLFCSK